jgi:hypothetical protein
MEIEDRIANTELVVSPRRGRSYSDMFYVSLESVLLMREVPFGGVHRVVHIMRGSAAIMNLA